MEALPTREQVAQRVRAARAYAGMKAPELAQAMGYSERNWSRVENGDDEGRPLDSDQRALVAELCNVPRAFMELGFEGLGEAELVLRMQELQADVARHLRTREEPGPIAGLP